MPATPHLNMGAHSEAVSPAASQLGNTPNNTPSVGVTGATFELGMLDQAVAELNQVRTMPARSRGCCKCSPCVCLHNFNPRRQQ
jgi:hypothetical protein